MGDQKTEVDLKILFADIFERFSKIMKAEGIDFTLPKVILVDYPNLAKHNIQSRKFTTPYLDKDDEVGGNLYSWIHQSYSVLWEVDRARNEIVIIKKTNEKLGCRFATLLKMDKEAAKTGAITMSAALTFSELLWENIFKKSDLTKGETEKLKKEFIFDHAHRVLIDNLDCLKILNRFMLMFAAKTKSKHLNDFI